MQPSLHTWLSISEAVAAFGGEAVPVELCDEQFVILPSVVLCFVTIDQNVNHSQVTSPSQLVLRPSFNSEQANSDHNDWFPENVREVWDRSGPQIRKLCVHEVFIRSRSDERFFYAGEAHLGSYSHIGKQISSANFSLNHPLPRDLWLRLGGYSGWLVEVNHESHRLNVEDLKEFNSLIGELLIPEYSHLSMTRYEQDSLSVYINSRRVWFMYLRDPDDCGVYAQDMEYDGPEDSEEVFRCECGIDLEFLASHTLPREMATQVATEFFQTGRLPDCVHWKFDS